MFDRYSTLLGAACGTQATKTIARAAGTNRTGTNAEIEQWCDSIKLLVAEATATINDPAAAANSHLPERFAKLDEQSVKLFRSVSAPEDTKRLNECADQILTISD